MEFHGYLAWLEEEDLAYKQLPRANSVWCGCHLAVVMFTFLKLSLFGYQKKYFPFFRTSCQQPHLQEAQQWLRSKPFSTFTRLFTKLLRVKFACPLFLPAWDFFYTLGTPDILCCVCVLGEGEVAILNAFF